MALGIVRRVLRRWGWSRVCISASMSLFSSLSLAPSKSFSLSSGSEDESVSLEELDGRSLKKRYGKDGGVSWQLGLMFPTTGLSRS